MDIGQIVGFVKQNGGTEVATLQKQFDIGYKLAKDIVDDLVAKGELKYTAGVRYDCVRKAQEAPRSMPDEFERFKAHLGADDPRNRDAMAKYAERRRRFFEFRRLRSEDLEEDDDDDDDENDEDDDEDDDDDIYDFLSKYGDPQSANDIDEDELRKKALKLCVERGNISLSLLQRTFPIGYARANKLMEWMEERGYVSPSRGALPRQVFITQAEYEALYPEPFLVERDIDLDDDDDDDDEDDFDDLSLFSPDEDDEDDDEDDYSVFPLGDEEKADYDKLVKELFGEEPICKEKKSAVQSLACVLGKIAEKKKAPVDADTAPAHNLWSDKEFSEAVMARLKAIITSDKKMGRQGAVKKAETYLEAVRDTHDRKMVQVYERLVYELKNASNYLYAQLKKQFFEE